MASTNMDLPEGFGLVMMVAGCIGYAQFGIGSTVMLCRKVFGAEEFTTNPEVLELQAEHAKAFEQPMDSLGYPDNGEGRYAKHLNYRQWAELNHAQRDHKNMVDHSAPVLTAMVLNGFFQPKLSAVMGAGFLIGRVLFTWGRMAKANYDNRTLNAVFNCGVTLGLGGLLMYNGLDRLLYTGEIRFK